MSEPEFTGPWEWRLHDETPITDHGEDKWSPRKSVLFTVSAGLILWTAIFFAVFAFS